MFNEFIFEESYLSRRSTSFKKRIFRWITTKSSNLFLRSKDTISINPITTGFHEEPLTNLIKFFAKNEYSDFLIDIGANIGITSCQNGNEFDSVYMFEPNPHCFKILEVNVAMNLDLEKCNFYNFGLGLENKRSKLVVPKYNWGGAFVQDSTNSYSSEILAKKDGFKDLDSKNYFTLDIEIRKTSEALNPIFSKIGSNKRGVIKIDVEGYEYAVLSSLSEILPKSVKAIIIFESFDKHFDMQSICNRFERNIKIHKLVKHIPWKDDAPNFMRSLCFKPIINTLDPVTDNDWCGDLVLEIS